MAARYGTAFASCSPCDVALTPTAREQVIALAAAGIPSEPSLLARWPRENGLLIDPQARTVNASDNGVALLAAQHAGIGGASFVADLASAVVGMKGVKLPSSPTNRQDNTLQ